MAYDDLQQVDGNSGLPRQLWPSPQLAPAQRQNLNYNTPWPQLPANALPSFGGSTSPGPFDFVSIDGSGNLTIFPGTVNQLIVDNPTTPVAVGSGALTYVTINCNTDGSQVTSAAYGTSTSPPAPPVAVKGGLPSSFVVTLGFVVTSGGTSTLYQTWPQGCNVAAIPQAWILTDREDPEPGQTLQEQWYTWNIIAAINAPP